MKELTTWQKLAVTAAVLCVVAIIAYMPLGIASAFNKAKWLAAAWWMVAIPSNLYLSIFALWHWRTRYAGKRALGWALFFFWMQFLLPAVCYFFTHILPDIRQRGAYAPAAPEPAPPLPIPPAYENRKSLCFVAGWGLVSWTVAATLIGLICWEMILYIYLDTVTQIGPQRSPQELAKLLELCGRIFRIGIWGMGACAFLAAIGAIFLYMSQRMKWNIAEQEARGTGIVGSVPMPRLLARIESTFDNPALLKTLAVVASIAYAVAFAAVWGLMSKTEYNAKDYDEAKQVVVALGDLASGSILTTNNLAKKSFFLTNCTTCVVEPDQHRWLLGLSINRPIKHGQPIYWPDVLPPTNSAVRISK